MKRYKKSVKTNRQQRRKIMLLCIAAFLLGVVCGKMVFAKEETQEVSMEEKIDLRPNGSWEEEKTEAQISINEEREQQNGTAEEDWRLVLVNSTHFMEEGYVPELAEIENNYYFDARAVGCLQQMLADGRKAGMDIRVCSAYRTMDKQTSLYENKVKRLMREEGISYEEAYKKAGNTVAFPGTSEHQLGLAVDLVAEDYQLLDEKQAVTDEAKWLKEHCHEYGFILRYPVNKTKETGIIFEPWHYRYVGVEAATEIMEQGICLEEYLEAVKQSAYVKK